MQFKELLDNYGLSQEFAMDVMDEINSIPDIVDPEEVKRRRDLCGMTIVTIDGDDAKDLDDAVSVEELPNGNIMLGVHIADVSHYVREKTVLDIEAQFRGTSVYLIDQVVPMLPKKLSNGICSLNPQVDRLTLSVFMEISPFGAVEKYEILESVIKTTERMSYVDVTAILKGKKHRLADTFKIMQRLQTILEKKRKKRGSIDFDFPEPKIILDDTGKPVDIKRYDITISNKIIEEFMLVCNETVAKHMEKLNLPLVYRVHETPGEDKMTRFAKMLEGFGYKLRVTEDVTPKQLQDILKKIKGKDEEQAISTIMLRSLMKARYCEENLGHFGLAAKYYCHFTSPIRRYPDLAVHRIVKEWIHKQDCKRFGRYVEKVAKESSDAEVNAVEAEREWNKYKMCEYMEDKIGDEFEGFISSVTSFGVYVALPDTIEGLIPMRELRGDYYIFDEVHFRLTGRRTGVIFKIGDKIKVKLVRVSTELGQIDFIPIEEKKPKFRKKPMRKRRR